MRGCHGSCESRTEVALDLAIAVRPWQKGCRRQRNSLRNKASRTGERQLWSDFWPKSPARFGVPVSEKVVVQSLPLIGALGGAAIDVVF